MGGGISRDLTRYTQVITFFYFFFFFKEKKIDLSKEAHVFTFTKTNKEENFYQLNPIQIHKKRIIYQLSVSKITLATKLRSDN